MLKPTAHTSSRERLPTAPVIPVSAPPDATLRRACSSVTRNGSVKVGWIAHPLIVPSRVPAILPMVPHLPRHVNLTFPGSRPEASKCRRNGSSPYRAQRARMHRRHNAACRIDYERAGRVPRLADRALVHSPRTSFPRPLPRSSLCLNASACSPARLRPSRYGLGSSSCLCANPLSRPLRSRVSSTAQISLLMREASDRPRWRPARASELGPRT